MSDYSLAQMAQITNVVTTGIVAVDNAMDITFIFTQCTAAKVQGSANGTDYSDIEGSSSLLGSAGTLTLTTAYTLSFVRASGFTHMKPIFSGTNPICTCVRRWLRQSPIITIVRTVQRHIIGPVAGTA